MTFYSDQFTQFKDYLFTKESLEEKRLTALNDSIQRIKKYQQQESKLLQSQKRDPLPPLKDPLDLKEQQDYIQFFQRKILDYCQYFQFNDTVEATAMAFFNRFYLSTSVMEHDPRRILLGCLFLATKVEHYPISLQDFLNPVKSGPQPSEMVDIEFIVSQGLGFKYMCHHPYLPLHGFFLDIQALAMTVEVSPANSGTKGSTKRVETLVPSLQHGIQNHQTHHSLRSGLSLYSQSTGTCCSLANCTIQRITSRHAQIGSKVSH